MTGRLSVVCALVAMLAAASSAVASAPPNDDFANAASITGPVTSIQLGGSTREAGEPVHGGVATVGTVWFSFTPASTRRVAVYVDAGQQEWIYVDGVVAVYAGSDLADLHPVGATLASFRGSAPDPYVAWEAVAGRTYFVAVGLGSLDDENPAQTLRLLDPRPPATNDDFEHARQVSAPGHDRGNLAEATVQAGEPDVAPGSHSVWLRLRTRTTLGVTFSADVDATELDALSAVSYTGATVRHLHPVGRAIEDSTRMFVARAATTYHLRISYPSAAALSYDASLIGQRLRGKSLRIDPDWTRMAVDLPVLVDERVLPVGVVAWSSATVAVQLRIGPITARRLGLRSRVISLPKYVRIAGYGERFLFLDLTPVAVRALRGVKRLDAGVRATAVGSPHPYDTVTAPVHLRG